MNCTGSSPETRGRYLAGVALADLSMTRPGTVRPHPGLCVLFDLFSNLVCELRSPVTESNRRPSPYHAGRFRPTASHWVGLPQARGVPVSERVALRLRSPEAVVTWFVTGSRPHRPPRPGAHAGRPRAPGGRAAGQRAAASPDPGHLFSFMIWFIAIGAVIVSGAVAGATWDQRKGRSRDTTAWSSVYRQRRISRPGPQGGYSTL